MLVAVCATPEGSPGGILCGSPEGVTVAEFNEMSDGESAVLLSASSTSMRSGWTREAQRFFL
jgi:hypothetical protein